jgi:hypothetical protein
MQQAETTTKVKTLRTLISKLTVCGSRQKTMEEPLSWGGNEILFSAAKRLERGGRTLIAFGSGKPAAKGDGGSRVYQEDWTGRWRSS